MGDAPAPVDGATCQSHEEQARHNQPGERAAATGGNVDVLETDGGPEAADVSGSEVYAAVRRINQQL